MKKENNIILWRITDENMTPQEMSKELYKIYFNEMGSKIDLSDQKIYNYGSYQILDVIRATDVMFDIIVNVTAIDNTTKEYTVRIVCIDRKHKESYPEAQNSIDFYNLMLKLASQLNKKELKTHEVLHLKLCHLENELRLVDCKFDYRDNFIIIITKESRFEICGFKYDELQYFYFSQEIF